MRISSEIPDEDRFSDLKRKIGVKEEESDLGFGYGAESNRFHGLACKDDDLKETKFLPYLNPRPISSMKPGKNMDRRIQLYSESNKVENGPFPEEEDWFLVGRAVVKGLSTCKGTKLEFDEIVDFNFPCSNARKVYNRLLGSSKGANALSEIVRFSTKRSGEVSFS